MGRAAIGSWYYLGGASLGGLSWMLYERESMFIWYLCQVYTPRNACWMMCLALLLCEQLMFFDKHQTIWYVKDSSLIPFFRTSAACLIDFLGVVVPAVYVELLLLYSKSNVIAAEHVLILVLISYYNGFSGSLCLNFLDMVYLKSRLTLESFRIHALTRCYLSFPSKSIFLAVLPSYSGKYARKHAHHFQLSLPTEQRVSNAIDWSTTMCSIRIEIKWSWDL